MTSPQGIPRVGDIVRVMIETIGDDCNGIERRFPPGSMALVHHEWSGGVTITVEGEIVSEFSKYDLCLLTPVNDMRITWVGISPASASMGGPGGWHWNTNDAIAIYHTPDEPLHAILLKAAAKAFSLGK